MEYTLDARVSAASVRSDRLMHDWHDHRDLDKLATAAKEMRDRYDSICRDAIDQLRLMQGVPDITRGRAAHPSNRRAG